MLGENALHAGRRARAVVVLAHAPLKRGVSAKEVFLHREGRCPLSHHYVGAQVAQAPAASPPYRHPVGNADFLNAAGDDRMELVRAPGATLRGLANRDQELVTELLEGTMPEIPIFESVSTKLHVDGDRAPIARGLERLFERLQLRAASDEDFLAGNRGLRRDGQLAENLLLRGAVLGPASEQSGAKVVQVRGNAWLELSPEVNVK